MAIRSAAITGYISGAAALLWPLARLATGRPEGIAPHLLDALILLVAAFWLQTRRSVAAAVVLLAFSAVSLYSRYLSGENILILGFGLLLMYLFFLGALAAWRLRGSGSPETLAEP